MTDKKPRKPKTGKVTHTVRTSTGRYRELQLTRKLAMALMCTECMGFEGDPADCTSVYCPLYPWRVRTRVAKDD